MILGRALFALVALFTFGLLSSAQAAKKQVPISALFGRIWNITQAASQPARGSIYIFLPNGTLLMTSCGETYRIATWARDHDSPDTLRITEDGRVTQSLTITSVTPGVAYLNQTLLPAKTQSDLTLKSITREFICPDLRR